MAENPVIFDIPENTWVRVAENVTTGTIHRISLAPTSYLQTYVKTGETAPTGTTLAAELFYNDSFGGISTDEGIDVYVMCVGDSGRIRIDL